MTVKGAIMSSAASLAEHRPREQKGRDTISRFQAQFRAAAYQCLSILSGKDIDRVYCDYHDDFVTRISASGKNVFHFYQVKTKEKANAQWNKLELFGLTKKGKTADPASLMNSHVGKLLLHTVRFNSACGSVVFLTNIEVDDDIVEIAKAIKQGHFSQKDLACVAASFNDAFCKQEPIDDASIQAQLKKLHINSGIAYLDPKGSHFSALARDAIYQYSEVDLQYVECEEIIRNLIALVEKKSFAKVLTDVSEKELDDLAGIGISDLLEILSVSKGAYDELLKGGDPNAVKNASIIQRKLKQANASADVIKFASKCKVEWDVWFREKRHLIPEFDMHAILEEINDLKNHWVAGTTGFAGLKAPIKSIRERLANDSTSSIKLTEDLIMGAVFAALVRSES